MNKILISSILFSQLIWAGTSVLKDDIITQKISFENTQEIAEWPKNSNMILSSRHSKDGSQSLQWDISAHQSISLTDKELPGLVEASKLWPGGQPENFEPSFFKAARHGGIKLWLYRESPNPTGELHFAVAANKSSLNDNPKYRFSMKQNFTGWRAFWVHFEEDAKVENYSGPDLMKAIKITPSADMTGDRVYLDMLQFLTFISRKRHSDLQYSNNKTLDRTDSYEILSHWNNLSKFGPEKHQLTPSQVQNLAQIEANLEFLIKGNHFGKNTGANTALLNRKLSSMIRKSKTLFKQLNIRRHDGAISGLSLFSSRDEQGAEKRKTFQELGHEIFFPMAMDYALEPNAKKKQDLIDLFDYYSDQGFSYGSSLGTTDHIIRLNAYANSVFLMRDVLAEQQTLDEKQKTLEWHTRFGKLSGWNKSQGENSDLIRGGLIPKLIAVLLLENTQQKHRKMIALKEYVEWATMDAPGYIDTIKPDGSIFHHRGAYQNSYGVQALTSFALFNHLLKGTSYELSRVSQKQVRKALKAQINFAADFELHPGICGRFPYTNNGLSRMMVQAFAFMALNGDEICDQEMANTFAKIYHKAEFDDSDSYHFPSLTYYGTFGTLERMEILADSIEKKESNRIGANGFYAFPYAGFANHKRSNFAASVKGFSKYVWDFESGHKGANPFGRYASFGALKLFTGTDKKGLLSLKASAMDLNKFNWSYMPGATTKELPIEKAAYFVQAHPIYAEGKHRNYTEQTFCGATTLGANGIFSLDLLDTVPADGDEALFEKGFSAKKSYFFFDNQIICLGSGINSSDSRYNTITTLFQNVLSSEVPVSASLNGKIIKENSKGHGAILRDTQENFYIVPQQYTVKTNLGQQQAVAKEHFRSKSFAAVQEHPAVKSWIDHGKAPNNANYEYSILVKSNSKQANKIAQKPNYKILQKDAIAHILKFGQNTTAYALFQANQTVAGPLLRSDTPVLFMAQESGDELLISLTDPDLRLAKWNHNMSHMPLDITNTPAAEHFVHFEVRGLWQVAAHADIKKVELKGANTLITLRVKHGLSRELSLSPIADKRQVSK
ncbi:chondroitinase family polysaccharide lyase [Lentisphaera profundi]|uniref:Chondroitinase family polysaccharide lyase n=1 Tax=Lentisphaera profundi TaxID=1658616 RepID=A0ABY7VT75_9BACT|nr:chondroitinase family polysaccharide lyase [Lentisphaera profundi]WDE97416.1 chondroitinase family polysaccharide lyase [Lentisphaera profundi]